MVDARLDFTILKDLNAEEEQAVENFIYRLGSENAFGDGIAVSEDEAIKFLMARKFDVGRAISLYHTHWMLRGKFELEHLEPNNEPLYSELQSGKFTVSTGKGPDGDTLCIFYARRHFPKLADHITVLQSIVFQLDSIMKKSDAQRQGLSLLYDMTSSGYSNFDFDLAMKVLHLLKGGYPARLKHVYIIAAPFWFRASMAILTNFLREKIKDRVEVVKTLPELYQRIPPEFLPRELGGNVDHNHKDWLDECMNHFHVSISSLNLTEPISENDKPEVKPNASIPSIELDSREIFENAENHENREQHQSSHENHDSVSNKEAIVITEEVSEPPDIPPPLPPRPPRRSPQPSPQMTQKFANRALPPEPPEAVPAFENSISDTDSLSERSSQGRQPLNLEEFIEYMASVGAQGIHKEYEELRSLPPPGTFESTLYPINTKKNRYNNILTFEETRVRLKRIDQDPFSDYINANYVNGYSLPKKFIGTQGPTPYTFNDFWRMIWEQKVGIIVMVTRCVERNRVKCGEYWPRLPEEAKQYGHIVVANIGQDESKDFTTTRFEIFNLQTDQTRYAYHIQFTTWPDFGVLRSATPILDVIQFIDSQQKLIAEHLKLEEAEKPTTNGKVEQELQGSGEYANVYTNSGEYANSGDYSNLEHTNSGEYATPAYTEDKAAENPYPPVVIHCSAGVGRSGTFCCISNAVERLQKTGMVDIYSTVKSIREQRAFSIQTPDQYEFCYRGIVKYAARSRYEIREDLSGIVNQLLNLDDGDSSDGESG